MTYEPKAYVIPNSGSWSIVLVCPSGLRALLRNTYANQHSAEVGVSILGFRLIDPPKRDNDYPNGVVDVKAGR